MKKTNKEILDFYGLEVGDRVKIDCYQKLFVITEENIPLFMLTVSTNDYEIVKHKKIGEINCNKMLCRNCPLRAIDCDITGNTLYDALEKYIEDLNSFNSSLKPFEKAFIDALKAELDKGVEE